jgi:PHD/YefM family antitoxin component YafN of YafNO toxin-antitoxin module
MERDFMRTVTTEDVASNWNGVAAEAAKAPVRVHGKGLPDLVILSEAEYERFRRVAGERLKEVMDRIGATATSNGMTEERLRELLADES